MFGSCCNRDRSCLQSIFQSIRKHVRHELFTNCCFLNPSFYYCVSKFSNKLRVAFNVAYLTNWSSRPHVLLRHRRVLASFCWFSYGSYNRSFQLQCNVNHCKQMVCWQRTGFGYSTLITSIDIWQLGFTSNGHYFLQWLVWWYQRIAQKFTIPSEHIDWSRIHLLPIAYARKTRYSTFCCSRSSNRELQLRTIFLFAEVEHQLHVSAYSILCELRYLQFSG